MACCCAGTTACLLAPPIALWPQKQPWVTGIPEEQVLVAVFPGLPTAAELFILPHQNTSERRKGSEGDLEQVRNRQKLFMGTYNGTLNSANHSALNGALDGAHNDGTWSPPDNYENGAPDDNDPADDYKPYMAGAYQWRGHLSAGGVIHPHAIGEGSNPMPQGAGLGPTSEGLHTDYLDIAGESESMYDPRLSSGSFGVTPRRPIMFPSRSLLSPGRDLDRRLDSLELDCRMIM
ncbi:UNVERIFIED_CONTAM: hypothetical protein K2H54_047244 [Gekko kuhli]